MSIQGLILGTAEPYYLEAGYVREIESKTDRGERARARERERERERERAREREIDLTHTMGVHFRAAV